MANTVDIIVKAIDQASSPMNKIGDSFKSLTGFSLSAVGGIALAGKAVQASVQYTKQAIDANEKYVTSIVDMARFTGDQTDAMSRLVQVADDVFLSQEALNNAMSIGAKKGLDMSVEGILKLADQYNALATVQEKNTLLNDNFGRSGLPVGKLLELESAGIRKKMAAISDSLVVDKKAEQTAYAYKRALDELQDTLQGIQFQVAKGAMPAITAFDIEMADFTKTVEESGVVTKILGEGLDIATKALRFWDGVFSGDLSKWQPAKEGAKQFTDQVNLATDAIDENSKSMLSMVSSFTASDQTWSDAGNSLWEEFSGLMEKRAGLIKQGYSETGQAVKDVDKALEDNAKATEDNAIAHELATHKIILGYLEQQFMMDNVLSPAETNFLLTKGVEWGIYAETAVTEMQKVQDEWTGFNPENKQAVLTITTNHVDTYSAGGKVTGHETTKIGGYAAGADFTVPPGYPNDSYPMRVQSGEHVQVTPAGQSAVSGMSDAQMSQLSKTITLAIMTGMAKRG